MLKIYHSGTETLFRMKETAPMEGVLCITAERMGVEYNSLRLFLHGERIPADDTPQTLGLKDQDQLDLMLEQSAC